MYVYVHKLDNRKQRNLSQNAEDLPDALVLLKASFFEEDWHILLYNVSKISFFATKLSRKEQRHLSDHDHRSNGSPIFSIFSMGTRLT